MLVLTATTDKIQAVLDGAVTTNQLPCFASYRDITTTAYTPGRNALNTNSTTDIDLVGAPDSSTQRVIDFLSVYNADTVSATVTIKLDANGTEYILWKGILQTGEKLQYNDSDGFKVLDTNGLLKTANYNNMTVPAVNTLNVVVLSGDQTNNNASANTMQDVTGLSFAVTAGQTYWFEFVIDYTAAATTTGSRWAINGPATTRLSYTSEYSLTTTTKTVNNVVAYDTPAASNATSPSTAGNIATIWGYITPSANGTVIARFASEVSGSAIVAKAGSALRWIRTV